MIYYNHKTNVQNQCGITGLPHEILFAACVLCNRDFTYGYKLSGTIFIIPYTLLGNIYERREPPTRNFMRYFKSKHSRQWRNTLLKHNVHISYTYIR